MRTQNDIFFIFFYIVIEFFEAIRGWAQSGTRANAEFASIDQVEHTVLNNFGIYSQIFKIRVNQTVDNCVSNRTYTRLQRQQISGQTTCSNFRFKEFNQVFTHFLSIFVDFAQRTNFISNIAGNYCNESVQIARNIRSADYIFRFFNRNSFTIRRIQRHIGVMHAFQFYWLRSIYFNNNFFSTLNIRRRIAHGSCRNQTNLTIAKVNDFAGFDDSNVYTSAVFHETIASHLSNMAQMQVSIFYGTVVDSFTQIIVSLVRHTTSNDTSLSHCGIHFRTYRSTGPNVDLERSFFAFFCQSKRHSFRITRRSKTTGTYVVAILYKFCSCFGAHNFAGYCFAYAIFNVDHVYLPPCK